MSYDNKIYGPTKGVYLLISIFGQENIESNFLITFFIIYLSNYQTIIVIDDFLFSIPFNADTLSNVLVEHFVALQERLSSSAGH